jgi:hypothetical protein
MLSAFWNMQIINFLEWNVRFSCYSENAACLRTEFENRFNGLKLCEIKFAMSTEQYNFGVDKAHKNTQTKLVELQCDLVLK